MVERMETACSTNGGMNCTPPKWPDNPRYCSKLRLLTELPARAGHCSVPAAMLTAESSALKDCIHFA